MSSPEITGRILYTFQSSWPTVRNVSIALFVALCAVRGGSALAPDGVGLSGPRDPMPTRLTVALPSTGSADELHRGGFPECSGGSGDCCVNNGTPGCNDPSCCDTVCTVDPFCCDTAGGGSWDDVCAVEAFELCGNLCGGGPSGACCESNDCTETHEIDCLGSYQGDGVPCLPDPCPGAPIGACCDGGGFCIETDQFDCENNLSGTYQGDGSSCVPDPCCVGPLFEADPNLAIPDNDSNGVTDTINVPDDVTVLDLNVDVQITHTWIGDLIIEIEHNGTTVRLWDRGCASFDDMDVIFDDEGSVVVCATPTTGNIIPFEALSAFDGMSSQGNWTISVSDNVEADTGTLDHWSLHFDCPGVPPIGACCSGTRVPTCTETTQSDCEINLGGIYQGDGTFCVPDPCETGPPEACCLPDGSCIDDTPDNCLSSGGAPLGPDSACSGSDSNANGVDDACEDCIFCDADLDGNSVVDLSDFNIFVSCVFQPPVIGTPCQQADLNCDGVVDPVIDQGIFECLFAGNPPEDCCDDPPEACCFGDGSCQNLPPSVCLNLNGQPVGPGTACQGDGDSDGFDDICGTAPPPDRWNTCRDPTEDDQNYHDFATDPIPADFFDPGSEPFTGQIELQGNPLDEIATGDADTLIQRSADPFSPSDPPGTFGVVDIEIIALNLVSVEPIVVTYGGGNPPELWDCAVTLSDDPQQIGSLAATKTHDNGGTFDSNVEVLPKFTFTRVGDGAVRVLDAGTEGLAPLSLSGTGTPFVHAVDPGLDVALDPGSTFNPGIEETSPGDTSSQVVTPITEEEQLARHLICVPKPKRPRDYFRTWINDPPLTDQTYHDFLSDPIPAGFFGAGCAPFSGRIELGPRSLNPGTWSEADTVVERESDPVAPSDPNGTIGTVPIQLIELSLESLSPITVDCGGEPVEWNVKVTPSSVPAPAGSMTATKTHANGGTFDSTLFVQPKYTFTRIQVPGLCPNKCGDINGSGGNVNLVDFASFAVCFNGNPNSSVACGCSDLNESGGIDLNDLATFSLIFNLPAIGFSPLCGGAALPTELVLDTGELGLSPVQLDATGVPFVHALSADLNVFVESGATFVPGVSETTPGDPTSQTTEVTSEEALLASHTICPPKKCTVDLDIDSDNNNGNGPPDRSAAEDAIETTAPGKIIWLNDDDDDGGGTADNAEEPIRPNPPEDEPVIMILELQPNTPPGFWRITYTAQVEVYDAEAAPHVLIPSGAIFAVPLVANPKTLKVEGVALSAAPGDVSITAEYDCDGDMVWDETDVVVATVAKVSTVVHEAINAPIDVNPNTGGGDRVFVDDTTPTDPLVRNVVRVKATVIPAVAGAPLFFRAYDVDDPSSAAAPIDKNDGGGAKGDDNRGRLSAALLTPTVPVESNGGGHDGHLGKDDGVLVLGPWLPEGGILTDTTDAAGVASAELLVTFQPGDNFRTAVSCVKKEVEDLGEDGLPSGNDPDVVGFAGKVSPMLTVWRKMYLEFDSMGPADNTAPDEDLFGIVTDTNASGSTALTATLLTDASETWQPDDQLIGSLVDPDTGDGTAVALVCTDSTATTVTIALAGSPSVGLLTLAGALTIVDGETFTLGDGGTDGTATTTTFEFDNNGAVGGGNVQVNFAGLGTLEALENVMVNAINGVAALGITATRAAGSSAAQLFNDNAGSAGNVAIAETVAHANFQVAGMLLGTGDGNLQITATVGDPYSINTDDVAPPGAPPDPVNIGAAAALAMINQADMYPAAYIRGEMMAGGLDTTDDQAWDRNYSTDEADAAGAPTKDVAIMPRYWAMLLLSAYDVGFDEDNDPNPEPATFGFTPAIGPGFEVTYSTGIVYRETSRDFQVAAGAATADEAATAAHEILHSFAACHFPGAGETDDDIMTDDFPVPAGKQKLNNKHINMARTIRMPTLGPSHGVDCEVN